MTNPQADPLNVIHKEPTKKALAKLRRQAEQEVLQASELDLDAAFLRVWEANVTSSCREALNHLLSQEHPRD